MAQKPPKLSIRSPLPFGVRLDSTVSYLLATSYWALLVLSFGHKVVTEYPLAAIWGFAGFAALAIFFLAFRWKIYAWLRTILSARVIITAPVVVYLFLLLGHAALLFLKSRQESLVETFSIFNLIFHGLSMLLFSFTWMVVGRLNDAILLQSAKGKSFVAKNGTLDLAVASLAYWGVISVVMLNSESYQHSLFFILPTFAFFIISLVFINENLIRQVKIYVTRLGDALEEEKPLYNQQKFSDNPYYFESHLTEMLLGDNEKRKAALFLIRNVPLVDKVEELRVLIEWADNEEQKDDIAQVVRYLDSVKDELSQIENRYEFLERSQDIQLLRALIRIQIEKSDINVVIKALNDTRKEIRKSAILVAGYLGDTNFIPQIIQSLDDPYLCVYARHALVKMNEKGLKYLEVEFYKRRNNAFFTMNVISTVADLNNESSERFLLDNLYEPNQNIQLFVVKKIIERQIRIPDKHVLQVKLIVENLIANYIFIQNVCMQIKPNQLHMKPLLNALKEEKEEYFNLLQNILKRIYNPFLVDKIFSMLGSEDFFSKYFGLNFLELHFSPDLKNKLRHVFAYPDGSYDFSKVRDEFMSERLNMVYRSDEEMVMDIMKRGYNKISLWSKASAMITFVKTKPNEVNEEFTAEFFSSNELLREISAMVIYRHFIDEYLLLSFRLEKPEASRLEYLIKDNLLPVAEQSWNNDNLLKYNKIFFLSNLDVLKGYSNRELVVWEKLFEVRVLERDTDNIFVPFIELSGYWIIESGKMQISIDRRAYVEFEKGDIINMSIFDFSQIGSIHIKKNGPLRYLLIDELAFINLVPEKNRIQSSIKTIQPTAINQKFEELTMEN